MKISLKKLVILAAVAVLMIALAGCQTAGRDVVGVWGTNTEEATAVYVFAEDGTIACATDESLVEGTYQVSGDQLTINGQTLDGKPVENVDPLVFSYQVVEDTLTLTIANTSSSFSLHKLDNQVPDLPELVGSWSGRVEGVETRYVLHEDGSASFGADEMMVQGRYLLDGDLLICLSETFDGEPVEGAGLTVFTYTLDGDTLSLTDHYHDLSFQLVKGQ